MSSKALHILNQYWGYTSFRHPQEEIINAVLNYKDTIALLPTGGGKSICFQIPALINEGVCIVISPLLALIQDQVESLTKRGIKATTIPSGSSQDEIITLFDNIRFGNYKFLYLSPERLQSRFIQEKIKQLTVNLIAIDEAHCISEWGHDFRPSYTNISILRELHSNINIIALTASATNKVIDDIKSYLELKSSNLFKKSFNRQNLAYQIFNTEDKLYKITQIFTKIKAPAIVYVSSRNRTKEISAYLNAKGFKSSFYHGGLSALEKQISFDNWMSESTPIMVATNAFGMGIDKSNVRVVIHLNLPSSLENYIQEAGRGGRDGKKAFSVILTNKSDVNSLKELQQKQYPTINEIKIIHKKLYQHFQISKGEHIESSFDFDFLAFSNKYNFIPNKVSNALQLLNNNGVITLNSSFKQKSTIQFIASSKQIINYSKHNSTTKTFIQALLRIYGGVFEQPVKINEFYIAKKASITSTKVVQLLDDLVEKGYLEYKKSTKNTELFFLLPREDDYIINRISKNIKAFYKQKKQKVNDITFFVENNTVCRSIQLLNYFDEETTKKCGICDVCLRDKKGIKNNIEILILNIIKEHKELSSKEICTLVKVKEGDILIHLRKLLANEIIGITNYNKYFIK
ncbi:ATP-dependent DNA helicase RecQ [Tenacibaculum sp. MAR_2010_89]|uniref:RecQ family ATP-dependent DNA helicase n=1 Tax=Tenacibaculum sp. MAR_2010_89 TaxID=1250198 RepID=UPI000896E488|nr:ATP-dependent DNA helicase RecQ [Tenacibaculum sp. MAR_2010_89]SEE62788.1 ATP-dependent DNA helicase RecQ [Tenacibaculum sp. MAR_2010_89]